VSIHTSHRGPARWLFRLTGVIMRGMDTTHVLVIPLHDPAAGARLYTNEGLLADLALGTTIPFQIGAFDCPGETLRQTLAQPHAAEFTIANVLFVCRDAYQP
jgi:hypothetical protein